MGLFLALTVRLELESARSREDSAIKAKLVHLPWVEESATQIRDGVAHRINGVGVNIQQVVNAKGQTTLLRHRVAEGEVSNPLSGKSLVL